MLGTVINAGVVATVGLILGFVFNGRLTAIEQRIDRLERRMDERFAQVDERFALVQRSLDDLRSDLTRVALAVDVRPEADTGR